MVVTILSSSPAVAVLHGEIQTLQMNYSHPDSLTPWKPRPALGPQKTLVLLVEFQNARFRTDPASISSIMSTVDQWFRRASYGKMSINYTIHEQVLTLPGIMADYGAPTSGAQEGDDPQRTQAYFYDALSMIPDTILSQYKHIILIHAGDDEAISGKAYDIWSQCDCSGPIADEDPANEASWVITDSSGQITHAFWGVSTFSENERWPILAHEFTHSLGVSDLYIYGQDGYSESAGVGFWSNMATGAFLDPPSDIDGWSKYILGWISAVRVESSNGNYTIHTLDSAEEPKAILVPISGGDDYYFITARRKAGTDVALPSEGVIVFRIDPYREESLSGQELALLSDANPTTPSECYAYNNPFQDLCMSLDAPYNLKGRDYAFTYSSLDVAVVLNDDAFWSQDAHIGFKVTAAGGDAFKIAFAASPEDLGIPPTVTTTSTTTQTPAPQCVIATAAYGSEMANEVVYLRTVRDQLIGSTPAGRTIVDAFNMFYYSWSPQVAQLISPSSFLRGLFRVLLRPIIWIASVAALIFALTLDLTRNGDAASVSAFLAAAVLTTSLYIGLPILGTIRILSHRNARHSTAGSRKVPSTMSHHAGKVIDARKHAAL
jgi:M6 family metalloprotease-like protein